MVAQTRCAKLRTLSSCAGRPTPQSAGGTPAMAARAPRACSGATRRSTALMRPPGFALWPPSAKPGGRTGQFVQTCFAFRNLPWAAALFLSGQKIFQCIAEKLGSRMHLKHRFVKTSCWLFYYGTITFRSYSESVARLHRTALSHNGKILFFRRTQS